MFKGFLRQIMINSDFYRTAIIFSLHFIQVHSYTIKNPFNPFVLYSFAVDKKKEHLIDHKHTFIPTL